MQMNMDNFKDHIQYKGLSVYTVSHLLTMVLFVSFPVDFFVVVYQMFEY